MLLRWFPVIFLPLSTKNFQSFHLFSAQLQRMQVELFVFGNVFLSPKRRLKVLWTSLFRLLAKLRM